MRDCARSGATSGTEDCGVVFFRGALDPGSSSAASRSRERAVCFLEKADCRLILRPLSRPVPNVQIKSNASEEVML